MCKHDWVLIGSKHTRNCSSFPPFEWRALFRCAHCGDERPHFNWAFRDRSGALMYVGNEDYSREIRAIESRAMREEQCQDRKERNRK